jgi:hypothetical protein
MFSCGILWTGNELWGLLNVGISSISEVNIVIFIWTQLRGVINPLSPNDL